MTLTYTQTLTLVFLAGGDPAPMPVPAPEAAPVRGVIVGGRVGTFKTEPSLVCPAPLSGLPLFSAGG